MPRLTRVFSNTPGQLSIDRLIVHHAGTSSSISSAVMATRFASVRGCEECLPRGLGEEKKNTVLRCNQDSGLRTIEISQDIYPEMSRL